MIHEPYVMPFVTVTEQWVVRCDCGLFEQYAQESDAQARAAEHARDGS